MKRALKWLLAALWSVVGGSVLSFGQMFQLSDPTTPPNPASGHASIQHLNATVDPRFGALNLQVDVPLPPGRQLNIPFAITYNSNSVFLMRAIGDFDTGSNVVLGWVPNNQYLGTGGGGVRG